MAINLDANDALTFRLRSLAFSAKHDLQRAMSDDAAAIRLDPKFVRQ